MSALTLTALFVAQHLTAAAAPVQSHVSQHFTAIPDPASSTRVMADGTGILNWGTVKNAQLSDTLKAVAGTVGVGYIIYHWIRKGFGMATLIGAILAGGLFIWGVLNINTTVKDHVQQEVGSSAVSIVRQATTPSSAEPMALAPDAGVHP